MERPRQPWPVASTERLFMMLWVWQAPAPMTRTKPSPPATASTDTNDNIATQLGELTKAVNDLKDEIHVVRQVMDEIREDLEYAVRQLQRSQWTATPTRPVESADDSRTPTLDDRPPNAPAVPAPAVPAPSPNTEATHASPSGTNVAARVSSHKHRRPQGRKKPPLHERIYYKPYFAELVKLVGYDGTPLAQANEKLKFLIDQYGREVIEEATREIVAVDDSTDPPIARLTEEARKLAWPILGERRSLSPE
jgi:hypothetical protein